MNAGPGRAGLRPYSLRKRLILTTVGSTAVCWLVSLALIVGVAWRETSDVFDDTLEEAARLVAVLSASMQQRGELAGDDDIVMDGSRQRVQLYYQVVSENGAILRRSRHVPDTPFVRHVDDAHAFYNVWLDGRAWRVHALHVRDQDFFVQVAQPWDSRTDLLEEVAERLVWPALALLVLLGAVNWLAIRRLFKPLERMARDIRAKSPDDLRPVAASRADELRPMVTALNGVLARLADALQSERRFTADAVHELRTPLAALRMKIQLLQRTAGPDVAQALQGLAALRADVDRCTALVENLLALARLDPQQPGSLAREAVDARELVQGALDDSAAVCQARQMQVERDVADRALSVHAGLMRSALRNLIDNAARYGRPGGRIRIEAGLRSDGWACIAVRDDGPGVSGQDRQRLTQRFFRALGSQESGSGLGLSIVERIAELHGGRLRLEDGLDGQGLAVIIDWPQPKGSR
ncbi:MAG: Sensor protein QseC [Paracidovorax wautersii]|uniref:histidine kinase n=1 Tax=Paracidovorax wautersii TaxID=1177982 RepID=A0A7V8JRB6_9BURK|nr:MAG: Sensor protein QseC [Paracidovorax wautersii]